MKQRAIEIKQRRKVGNRKNRSSRANRTRQQANTSANSLNRQPVCMYIQGVHCRYAGGITVSESKLPQKQAVKSKAAQLMQILRCAWTACPLHLPPSLPIFSHIYTHTPAQTRHGRTLMECLSAWAAA